MSDVDEEDFLFGAEEDEQIQESNVEDKESWKVLIVDDEKEIHSVTRLAFSNFEFEGKNIDFHSAYSGAQAIAFLRDNADTALILLDVVMETDDAGLQVARKVREELKNNMVRIILRTGQPGQAPEQKVILDYDINDYKAKTELTAVRLFTTLVASLRSFRELQRIEISKQGLMKIVDASSSLFQLNSLDDFIDGVLQQMSSLVPFCAPSMVVCESSMAADEQQGHIRVLSGTGKFASLSGKALSDEDEEEPAIQLVRESLHQRCHLFEQQRSVLYIEGARSNNRFAIYLNDYNSADEWERQLIDLFAANLSVAYDNVQLMTDLGTLNQSLEQKVQERTKELEKATGRAEAASNTKSVFLANMSHEIRTPMNAIMGYAQILQKDKGLSETQKKTIATILRSSSHLLELINDVLDLSKIEAGAMELSQTDFDLMQLCGDLDGMFSLRCAQKKIDWQISAALGDKVPVHGDQQKLRQVLINLLGNAVKLTDEGKVELKLQRCAENRYLFEVIDTGPGIDKAEQQLIFESFRQTKGGEQKGGTGLGLTISRKYIELMGGKLMLDSTPGQGSRFFFEIDLDAAHHPLSVPACISDNISQLASGCKVHALVIDDVEENRDVLRQVLEGIGVTVAEGENGQQALDLMASEKPDIVFMDIRMPVMTGDEAVKKLRQQFGQEVKCVAISARSMAHEVEYYFDCGFDFYIAKPFKFGEIYHALQQLLNVSFESDSDNKTQQKPQPVGEPKATDLPADMHKKLLDAARLNRITELKTLVRELEQQQEEAAAQWVAWISARLAEYDTDSIVSLLESEQE